MPIQIYKYWTRPKLVVILSRQYPVQSKIRNIILSINILVYKYHKPLQIKGCDNYPIHNRILVDSFQNLHLIRNNW